MTIADALKFLGIIPNSVWVLFLFLILSFVEISKIKINPWSALFGFIGKKLGIDDMKKQNEKMQNDLSNHIVQSQRRTILDFADSLRTHQRHSKEQFDYVISICDEYDDYIKKNNIPNGQVKQATAYIKEMYQERLRKNDFL